jgi:SAM-dependent methyltransferase
MDRAAWLKETRRAAEERMDRLYAPIYDQNWGATFEPTHEAFLGRFLTLCPAGATILDAACGTGKYWPTILASGRTVHGSDQSAGMLARAHEKFPDAPIEKVGLQEMRFEAAFDGAICMDAMEVVFPEDWPLVLGSLHRAIKPGSYLYFTVELAAEPKLEQALAAGRELGLPVVYGEWAHEGGYHYYPAIDQVQVWLRQAGFRLAAEAADDLYHHLIVQRVG